MSDDRSVADALLIEGLTLGVPGGRYLLRDASCRVEAGAFVLLVGASGSGKSTLLRAIAGLDEPGSGGVRAGTVLVEGAPTDPSRGLVGLVFQNHALFDELSASQNVQFALDHRQEGGVWSAGEADRRLDDLGVPTGTPLSSLSGGERQRVAVARTLAVDPSLLLFDEPTTGLDPRRARNVADLIAKTHSESGKTAVVVTHDYAPFLRHNPRIILLDETAKALRDVDEDELAHHMAQARPVSRTSPGVSAKRGWWDWIPLSWIEGPGEALWILLASVVVPWRGWRRPRWKLRYLWHYLRMVALGTTAVYVAMAGLMLGFVTVFFGFSQFPYREVTLPLLTEEFLAAIGYSAYRVLVPLLVSILLAGKCGAAIAADVGARRLTHQFDAMRSFSVRPIDYLYGNIVVALLVAGPLLVGVAFLTNAWASMVAYLMATGDGSTGVFQRNYLATVWPDDQLLPVGTGWVVLKAASSGVVIAGLSYVIGARPKSSSVDVSRDVGLTIFWASLVTLALHSVYAFVEF